MYLQYTIYKITNLTNGKVYIGQTTKRPIQRWKEHLITSKHRDNPLYRAIRKHGIKKFQFEPICSCFDLETLNSMETFFILEHKSNQKEFGYNCDTGGKNFLRNKETKRRMALSHKGMGNKPGNEHPYYNHTVHTFIHETGVIEHLTQYEMSKKHNLNRGGLCQVIKGKKDFCKGWKIKLSE